jgi:hypothetical protein
MADNYEIRYPMDSTPAELAGMLDGVGAAPHCTGPLSMLDEASLAYGWRYPQVGPLQRAFAEARHAHMGSYHYLNGYSDEKWRQAVEAARALAEVLRPLGDARIERCARPTAWGVCESPLEEDGTCRSQDHTDGKG